MIKGSKVALRALERDDLTQLRDWRNNESFRKHFREFRELNMENQNTWFEKMNTTRNDFMFGIIELESGKMIGACGLLYINWIIRSADFSFYIGEGDVYINDNKGFIENDGAGFK